MSWRSVSRPRGVAAFAENREHAPLAARGRKLIAVQEAPHALDHRTPGLDELLNRTQGRGVDILMEMLANVNLAKDLNVFPRRGRVPVIGNRGSIEIDPREIMRRDASILGLVLLNVSRQDIAGIHAALGDSFFNLPVRDAGWRANSASTVAIRCFPQ